MVRVASILAFALLAGIAQAEDADAPWEIRGQVVDEQGKPVDDFEAATFWSANGKQWDDAGEFIKGDRDWKEEGVLAAFPKTIAKHLPNGTFSVAVDDRPRVSVFATDKAQTRGGYVSVEREAAADAVTINLAPLVRVHGKVFCTEADRTPDWTMAVVHPVGDQHNYLHFTQCGSYKGQFSFLLPPGKYDLDVYSSSPSAHMPKPGERKVKDAPADMPPYLKGIRIEVPANTSPATAELDLGVLNVELPKDKDGIGRDITQFYGKEPPALSITDARGVAKDVKLADFRGKWVLLDFWALWCGPCIGRSLPELTTFYEEHAADRDRFEILAICNTEKEKALTIEAYDALAAPVVKGTWNGKDLPFPVLIDGEGKTYGLYGIDGWPTVLLIDSAGHLVKDGDATMLGEELKKASP